MSLYMTTTDNISLWIKIDLIEMVHIKLEMLNEEEGEAVLLLFWSAYLWSYHCKIAVLWLCPLLKYIYNECLKWSYFSNFACMFHCSKCSFWKIKRKQCFTCLQIVWLTSYIIFNSHVWINGMKHFLAIYRVSTK